MNTPTKITFSRIVAIVLMMMALFVMFVINKINPSFVTPTYTLGIGNGWTGLNLVYLIMFVFFLIASYTDHLDGKLARKNNQVTNLGKFLDPVADKLLINSMVIFLALNWAFAPGQMTFSIWCAILLVARDIVVDAIRFIAAQKGKVIAANIFGKMKTVFEMVAIAFVLLNDFPFGLLYGNNVPAGLRVTDFLVYAATAMSVISGVIYVLQSKDVLKED